MKYLIVTFVSIILLAVNCNTFGQSHNSIKYFDFNVQNKINAQKLNKTHPNPINPNEQQDVHNSKFILSNNTLAKSKAFSNGNYLVKEVNADDSNKTTYTYDNRGNLLTCLYTEWKNNSWVNFSRITQTYDNNVNMLTHLSESWINMTWVINQRLSYTYDNNGNKLTFLSEDMAGGVFVGGERFTYTYDNNGNMLTTLNETWSNNAWVKTSIFTYTYDNQGNRLTYLDEYWVDNTWVKLWRHIYSYNNKGNMLNDLCQRWINNAWLNSKSYTYTYDINGNMLSSLFEDGSNNEMKIWTYDNSGNMLTYLLQRPQNGIWVNVERTTSTYDNQGNRLVRFGEVWNNDAWVSSYKSIYTYDCNGNMLSLLHLLWTDSTNFDCWKEEYAYDNNGNAIHGENYNLSNNVWTYLKYTSYIVYNNKKDSVIYRGHIVNVQYTTLTDVKENSNTINSFNLHQNYPNPFNPSTKIKFELASNSMVTLKIYDVLGREKEVLINGNLTSGEHEVTFDARNLSSGVYFYKIEASGTNGSQYSATKKMILVK